MSSDIFEVFKCYHNTGDVIECPFVSWELKYTVNGLSTPFMDGAGIINSLWQGSLPSMLHTFLVAQFLKDTITSKDDEVVVISNLEALDVWSWNDHTWVTSILRIFSFDISNRTRDREAPGKHSVWSHNQMHGALPIRSDVRDIVAVLVDSTPVFFYPFGLTLLLWLMISWQCEDLLPSVHRHYSPAITYIGEVAHVSNDQCNDSTRPASVNLTHSPLVWWQSLLIGILQESLLGFSTSAFDSFPWILWEIWMLDYQLMQLVPQIVSTRRSTMAIIDSKEGTSGPILSIFEFWLDYVQYNGDTIFIVVPDDSLMSIRRIWSNHSISFAGKLCRLVGLNKLDNRRI